MPVLCKRTTAPLTLAILAWLARGRNRAHDGAAMSRNPAADTLEVQHPPIVILVGLDESLASECSNAVNPVATIQTTEPSRALSQIVTLHPLLVIVRRDERADVTADVRERAAATGAAVVEVGAERGEALTKRIEHAMQEALHARAARRR